MDSKKEPVSALGRYRIKHNYPESKEFSVLVTHESAGSQKLIRYLVLILDALDQPDGGLVVIDELDAYLHPDLVGFIVNLFRTPPDKP